MKKETTIDSDSGKKGLQLKRYMPADADFADFKTNYVDTTQARILNDRKPTHGFWSAFAFLALSSEGLYTWFTFKVLQTFFNQLIKDKILSESWSIPLFIIAIILTLWDTVYNFTTFDPAAGAQEFTLADRNPVKAVLAIGENNPADREVSNLEGYSIEQQAKVKTFVSRFIKAGIAISLPSFLALSLSDGVAFNDLIQDPIARVFVSYVTLPILGSTYYIFMTNPSFAKVGKMIGTRLYPADDLETKTKTPLLETLKEFPYAATIEVAKQSLFNAFVRGLSAYTIPLVLLSTLSEDTQEYLSNYGISQTGALIAGGTTFISCLGSRSKGPLLYFFNPEFSKLLDPETGKVDQSNFNQEISRFWRAFDAVWALLPAVGLGILVRQWGSNSIASQVIGYTSAVVIGSAGYIARHNIRNWNAALKYKNDLLKLNAQSASLNGITQAELCDAVTKLYTGARLAAFALLTLANSQLCRAVQTQYFISKNRNDDSSLNPINKWFPKGESSASSELENFALVLLIYTAIAESTLLWQKDSTAQSMASILARWFNGVSLFTAPANFPIEKAQTILKNGKGHTFWGYVTSWSSCCREANDLEAGNTPKSDERQPLLDGDTRSKLTRDSSSSDLNDDDDDDINDKMAKKAASEPAISKKTGVVLNPRSASTNTGSSSTQPPQAQPQLKN